MQTIFWPRRNITIDKGHLSLTAAILLLLHILCSIRIGKCQFVNVFFSAESLHIYWYHNTIIFLRRLQVAFVTPRSKIFRSTNCCTKSGAERNFCAFHESVVSSRMILMVSSKNLCLRALACSSALRGRRFDRVVFLWSNRRSTSRILGFLSSAILHSMQPVDHAYSYLAANKFSSIMDRQWRSKLFILVLENEAFFNAILYSNVRRMGKMNRRIWKNPIPSVFSFNKCHSVEGNTH